jgi:hypothetical protein
MLRYMHDGVMTIKPGHQATGNSCVILSGESFFTQFHTLSIVYIWRTPMEVYSVECLVPRVKHGGDSMVVWAAILWCSILLVPFLSFVPELL